MSQVFDSLRERTHRYFDGLLRRVPPGPDGIARVGGRQIYIVPTRAGFMYGVVILVMLLGSLNYQNNLGLLLTFFLASVGLVAMHHAWFNLLGLAVQARGGSPVFAGEHAHFEVRVRAEGNRPRYDLRLRNNSERPPPIHVGAGDQVSITLSVPTERRGWHHLTEVMIETRHPMGLFRAWTHVATQAKTLVFPKPAPQAPEPGHDAGNSPRPHRTRHEGAEDYLGSRGYRPGDSIRHIDWKAYARERGLVVKQYGGEQGQEVWIDWARLSAPDPEIRLALLTRQVLDVSASPTRFGLRLPDAVEGLSQGTAHTERCLTRLALFGHAQD
ncbi:MAG: DUF58 domain-containing protein [Thermochromatium sp.]